MTRKNNLLQFLQNLNNRILIQLTYGTALVDRPLFPVILHKTLNQRSNSSFNHIFSHNIPQIQPDILSYFMLYAKIHPIKYLYNNISGYPCSTRNNPDVFPVSIIITYLSKYFKICFTQG